MTIVNQTVVGGFGDTENIINELLISQTQIEFSNEFIQRLEKKCFKNNLLFKNLMQNLCDSTVYNLGNSLLKSNSSTAIISLYFKDILLLKMVCVLFTFIVHIINFYQLQFEMECSYQTMELANMYLVKYWNDLQNVLIQHLYKSKSNIKNLQQIHADNKRNILRQFLLNLGKLEANHFEIIMTLLSSSNVDNDVLTKLIDHMVLVASIFSKNKQFGKLITAIIKIANQNALRNCTDQLKYIISEHKSFWKGQALKLLQSNDS